MSNIVRIPADEDATKSLAGPFIAACWMRLAAKAWRDYSHLGRGALLVPWSLVVDFASGNPRPFGAIYATEFEATLVVDLLARYEPGQSIVVVFIEDQPLPQGVGLFRLFGAMFAGIYSHEPPPPEAHVLGAS